MREFRELGKQIFGGELGLRLAGGGHPYPALLTSLRSWWSLDEVSGTRNDSHGTNHLTDNNTVASAAGKQGNAADFTLANSESLTINSNATLQTGDIDFSFAFWFNAETDTPQNTFLGKWTAAGDLREYIVSSQGADDQLYFSASSSGAAGTTSTVVATNHGAISYGTWYFVVIWHDATNNVIGISVNAGTPNTTAHSGGVAVKTGVFRIGRDDAMRYMDGLIDEVAFFERVLTADERTWLYNSGAGRAYAELT